MRPLFGVALATLLAQAATSLPVLACEIVNASQIAQAIRESPYTNDTLKGASCDFGGASIAESNGNTCASNGNNFGVLQLTRSNLPRGMSSSAYLALSPQQQVDIWAKQVGNDNTRGGYATLAGNSEIGGASVTSGMKAACFQFGPGICKHDIDFMRSHGGLCPTRSNGGVIATGSTLGAGTANLDGNGQSICSWGGAIQKKINDAAQTCSRSGSNDNTNGGGCVGGAPTTTTKSTVDTVPGPGDYDTFVGSGMI